MTLPAIDPRGLTAVQKEWAHVPPDLLAEIIRTYLSASSPPLPADVERLVSDWNEAAEGVTEGPWADGVHHAVRNGGREYAYITAARELVPIAAVPLGVEGYGREHGEANARFIAFARNNIRELLSLITALCEEIRKLKEGRDA
jgi:hypothetical protein